MSFCVQIALLSAITIGPTLGAPAQEADSTAPAEASNGNAILVNLSPPAYPSVARQANIREIAVSVTVTQMEKRKWCSKADTQRSHRPLSIVQSNLNSSAEAAIRWFPVDS